uniref:Uncharacterized protein n=1 Tax=Gopherus evgoodei TaxID=1825980 RepID=A0A8C4WE61_9SAUR
LNSGSSLTPVQEIQEETKCPICLEYLTDPVTIDCGHNFCRGCITLHCETWTEGDYDPLCCPSCRALIHKGALRNNYQLANIMEKIKQLLLGTGNRNLCVRHQEKLNLFCEEDWEAVCLVYERSPEYRSHTVLLMEQAAQKYKKLIKLFTLNRLRNCRDLSAESQVPKTKANPWNPGASQLEQASLRAELSNVTLDPDTAHPNLVLSEDRKSVRYGHARKDLLNNPERFDTELCELGCEGFTLGRHCWEVEVGDRGSWSVGVARESVRRKGWISLNPEGLIWAVEWYWWGQFWALTSPVTPLPLSRELKRIQVCLDCKRGQVTFFDAGNEAPIFTFPSASVLGERIHP